MNTITLSQIITVEVLSFASINMSNDHPVREWIEANCQPIYKDAFSHMVASLSEHLFSIDLMDNLTHESIEEHMPDCVDEFLAEIQKLRPDVSYIRFVTL